MRVLGIEQRTKVVELLLAFLIGTAVDDGRMSHDDTGDHRLGVGAAPRTGSSLDRVEVNRPSGQKVLDDAARRIVEMAAPYPPFPDAIRSDTDILEITRTWSFTTSDRLQSD